MRDFHLASRKGLVDENGFQPGLGRVDPGGETRGAAADDEHVAFRGQGLCERPQLGRAFFGYEQFEIFYEVRTPDAADQAFADFGAVLVKNDRWRGEHPEFLGKRPVVLTEYLDESDVAAVYPAQRLEFRSQGLAGRALARIKINDHRAAF